MAQSGKPHKRLQLWKEAIELVACIYEMTDTFPREEEFGLKSQLRRASVSVPSNIAEGLTRKSTKDKLHFLNIGQASLSEIDAQIEIAHRLQFLSDKAVDSLQNQLVQVEKLLSGLIRSLRNN